MYSYLLLEIKRKKNPTNQPFIDTFIKIQLLNCNLSYTTSEKYLN